MSGRSILCAALPCAGVSVHATDRPPWQGPNGLGVSDERGDVPSPILDGRYLYLMTDTGIMTALDALTGDVVYEGGRVPVPAYASPAIADGRIFIRGDRHLFAIGTAAGSAAGLMGGAPRAMASAPARAAGSRDGQ